MSSIILSFILIALIISAIYQMRVNFKWANTPLQNFPFYYRGKEYWYSRSVAVVMYVFCKNANGEWCVLANKRGKGAPDYNGLWNVSCGYLDFNETCVEAAVRECKEETNVCIDPNDVIFSHYNSNPSENKQNVSFKFYTILNGTINDYELSDKNSEKDEVDDIKWIPVGEIDSFVWAFKHDVVAKRIASEVLV